MYICDYTLYTHMNTNSGNSNANRNVYICMHSAMHPPVLGEHRPGPLVAIISSCNYCW